MLDWSFSDKWQSLPNQPGKNLLSTKHTYEMSLNSCVWYGIDASQKKWKRAGESSKGSSETHHGHRKQKKSYEKEEEKSNSQH